MRWGEVRWGEVRWGEEVSGPQCLTCEPTCSDLTLWGLNVARWWFSNGLEYLQPISFLNKWFNWLFMSFFTVFDCKRHSQGGETPEIGCFVGIKPAFNAKTKRTKKEFKRSFDWGGLCCKIQIPQSQLKAWIFLVWSRGQEELSWLSLLM